MDLLEKSSILLTPTAYNNGEALCIKPDDGSGDFQFSRNSAATRVNAQGLVENVQILSSNLVQNGDFSEEGTEEVSNGSFSQEGSELVTNGDFATDSDWIKATGWSISGGKANFNGTSNSNLQQNNVTEQNKIYKVSFEVSDYVSGTVQVIIGDNLQGEDFTFSSNGVFVFYTTADSGTTQMVRFRPTTSAEFSIDNVSVREVGQDWTLGTGWSIGEDKANGDGSGTAYSIALQSTPISALSGNTIKLEYTISNYVSGIIRPTLGVVNGLERNSNGTFIEYIKLGSNAPSLQLVNRATALNGSITNISVKEVGQNWELQTGWSIGNDVVTTDGTIGKYFLQVGVLEIGKTYKYSFDVLNNGNGIIDGRLRDQITGSVFNFSSEGTYTGTFTSLGTFFNIVVLSNNTTSFSVTNISVIEITTDTSLPRINYENFSYQDALGSELVVNGDFATDSDWAKGTGWSISGGSANGLATLDPIRQVISGFTDSKKYKVSFEITEVTNGFVRVYSYVGASGTFTKVLETPSQIGTYEVIFEFGGTNKNLMFYGSIGNGNFTGSIDNVSVKEYLGQEVVPDSGCGSWLFEPQSTNIITQSELFSDSSWIKTAGVTINYNYGVSPDGLVNSTRLEFGSSSEQMYASVLHSGNTEIASIYIKGISGETVQFGRGNNIGQGTTITLSGGWERIEQSSTIGGLFIIGNKDATATDIEIWGAQLEQQSYATSYIPTSGSTVTRNQDVCNNGGSLATINSTEGTLYAEIAALADDETNREIALSDGTTTNYVLIRFNSGGSNRIYTRVDVGGAIQYFDLEFSIDITNTTKIAIRYGDNNFATFINGSKVSSQLSGIAFGANTLTELAFDNGSGGANFFGKTKCVAVWKEALSDSELQSLTTI